MLIRARKNYFDVFVTYNEHFSFIAHNLTGFPIISNFMIFQVTAVFGNTALHMLLNSQKSPTSLDKRSDGRLQRNCREMQVWLETRSFAADDESCDPRSQTSMQHHH
jgi:hypothetical protein